MTDILVFPKPDGSAVFESRTVDGEAFLREELFGNTTSLPYDRQTVVRKARSRGLTVEFDWSHVVVTIARAS